MAIQISTYLVNERRHNFEARKLGGKRCYSLWTGNQVEEEDAVFRDSSTLEDLDGHCSGTTFFFFAIVSHGGTSGTGNIWLWRTPQGQTEEKEEDDEWEE